MKANVVSNRMQNEVETPVTDIISTSISDIVWHIAPSGEYYTIYSAAENKYLAATDAKNQARLIEDGTDDTAKWSVTVSAGKFEFENLARSTGTDPDSKWLIHNGKNGWACYADTIGQGKDLSLYRMDMNGYIRKTNSIASIQGTESAGAVTSLAIGYGAKISEEVWNSINSATPITEYGVTLIRETTLTANSKASVEAAHEAGLSMDISRDGSSPYSNGGFRYFTVKINITTGPSDYGTVYCAAPYIVAGGVRYYLAEMRYSVNTLATYCIANGGSNLSNEALATLE